MEIKVLGTGCTNCKILEKSVINSLAELNISANVEMAIYNETLRLEKRGGPGSSTLY